MLTGAQAPVDAPSPPAPVPPEPATDEPEAQVEVPPTGIHLVADRPVLDDATNSCPSCGHASRIDIVDLVGAMTHFSCSNCGTLWQVRGLHTANR